MAMHEFGIMEKEPIYDRRYDNYNPQDYEYISIADEKYILPIIKKLNEIECYWHTLKNKESGFCYYGITLIPPESLDKFRKILLRQNNSGYSDLIIIINKAKEENKYIINFGI